LTRGYPTAEKDCHQEKCESKCPRAQVSVVGLSFTRSPVWSWSTLHWWLGGRQKRRSPVTG
jgi:hypothetical protein